MVIPTPQLEPIPMRTLLILLVALLSTSCISGRKNAINLYGGKRSYNGDFDQVADPYVFGVEGMLGITSHGLSVEGGYAYAEESDSGAKLTTNEVYGGLRKTWSLGGLIQPYVGGGVNYMHGDGNDSTILSSSGDGIGAYLRAGLGFQIAIFQTGVDVRGALSGAEIEDENLSFVQGTIFIGLSL